MAKKVVEEKPTKFSVYVNLDDVKMAATRASPIFICENISFLIFLQRDASEDDDSDESDRSRGGRDDKKRDVSYTSPPWLLTNNLVSRMKGLLRVTVCFLKKSTQTLPTVATLMLGQMERSSRLPLGC